MVEMVLLVSVIAFLVALAQLAIIAVMILWYGTAALRRCLRKPCGRGRVAFGPAAP